MDSKGLTPVIAIVLLLFITVGAVGVVYTQFSDILSQGSESTDQTLSSLTSSVDIVKGEDACTVINTGSEDVDLANAVTVTGNGSVVKDWSGSLTAGDSEECGANPTDQSIEVQVDGTAIASTGN